MHSTSKAGSANGQREAVRTARPVRWPIVLAIVLGIAALGGLVGVVFSPMLAFEFVDFDVRQQITENPHIQGLTAENLKHIFTSRSANSYYPIRALSYAIDYELWGLNAGGFKLTNALAHLGNVILVFWLILRLYQRSAPADGRPMGWWEVAVAAFSAGVFAVHPVVVEPVVWVPGREELLMTLGALGCMHFYLGARRLEEDGGKARATLACYGGATLCCAVACLSNAVGAVIPLLILAWDLLTMAKPRARRILYGTAPLWAISAATIVLKRLGPAPDAVVLCTPFSGEWAMVILRTYLMNLKTLVWPTDLSLAYVLVTPASFLAREVILGGMAVALTGLALWKLRHRRLALFGLLWFCLALGPTSQILPHHVHRADRFLYLPLVGLVVALAIGLRSLANAIDGHSQEGVEDMRGRRAESKGPRVAGMTAIGLLVLAILAALSAGQVQTWRTSLSAWQQSLKVDWDNSIAHGALADKLAAIGRFEQAIAHYHIAMALNPENTDTLNNFALALAADDNPRFRDYDLAIRLAKRGYDLAKRDKPRLRRTVAIVYNNLAVSLAADGQYDRAVETWKKAIQADPDYEAPRFNLDLLRKTRLKENSTGPTE